ncbi:MAG TPA: AMP-binding protein [Herpetosiphonaceae bacterium]
MEHSCHWHLAALLEDAAARYGDQPFVIGQRSLTYNQAADYVGRLAAWLREKGIQRGDRVMIITMNRAEVIVAAFAAARVGAIFTVLHPTIKPYSLQKIIEQCTPSVVLLDQTTSHLRPEFQTATVIWAGETAGHAGDATLDDIIALAQLDDQAASGIDLDPVCLIYTSGSTGFPRGIILSHDNIRFSAAAIQQRLGYRSDDIVGLFLPLSFDYGLYQVFLTMQVGAALFIGAPEMVGPQFVITLATHRISILPGVPTMVAMLLKLLGRKPQTLPALRSLTNTGEHLPQAYIEQLQHHLAHVAIFAMYGLTECKRVSILMPHEMNTKPASVGRPLDGTESYVVDEHDIRLGPDQIGELVVRGRHVAQGYWNNEQETQLRFRRQPGTRPALYTGDLCSIDGDGFIYFVGRKDSLVKHKGHRVSLLEIEGAACQIPGIQAAAALKSSQNEKLYLFVAAAPGTAARSIQQELERLLEPYKLPDAVILLEHLPKNQNGKINRRQLESIAHGEETYA